MRRRSTARFASIAAALIAAASVLPAQTSTPPGRIHLATHDGFIPVGDSVRLFYHVEGNGPDTVVVLHGGPGLHFNTIEPDLTPLAASATLIYFDQRNAGRSTTVPDTSWINARYLVSDLEVVRKYFHLSRMTLLGHSWGSLLAGLYAVDHPDRVARMILMSSSPPAQAIRKFNPAGRIDSALNVVRVAQSAARQWRTDSTKSCWDYWMIYVRGYYPTAADSRRGWGDMCNVPAIAISLPWRAYALSSLSNYDLRPVLARVTAPVLVVHGLLDPMDSSSAHAWARSLKNARLFLVANAGHFPHVDQPRMFFPAVARFIHGEWPDGSTTPTESARPANPADTARYKSFPRVTSPYARTFAVIQATSDSLASAVGRQDWSAAAALYTTDGLMFAPGSPPLRGRQAVSAFWQAAHAKGLRGVSLQTMEVDGDAQQIVELGKYTLRGENDSTLDIGKYLVIWQRAGNGWRIARDVYNSNLETRSPLDAPDYLTAPHRPSSPSPSRRQ